MKKKEMQKLLEYIKDDLEKIYFISDGNNNTKSRVFNLKLLIEKKLESYPF